MTAIDYTSDFGSMSLYNETIRNLLKRILPSDIFYCDFLTEQAVEEWQKEVGGILPVVKWQQSDSIATNLSVYLLCHYRMNAGKFFLDIISRWLIPGKKVNVGLFFAADFKFVDISDHLYTVAEILICVEDTEDIEILKKNLAIIEAEIRLGVVSVYHASRILEIKGLTGDEKTSLIQERISSLVQNRSNHFDDDIFSQMQQFLVLCRDDFKAVREFQQMSRIISIFYLFRKAIRKQVETAPGKRYLSLKILRSRLYFPFGTKKVLSLFVGVNFLKENELFDQRHLLRALQNYIPSAKAIENSFFVHESRDEKIHTIYLEVEREDGVDFSHQEIQKLRKFLPDDLKVQVERLQRPIFMPRNEEEVMRNIVTLSQQLKYMKDIPQVVISFDEQTDTDLSFTVILVRVLLQNSPSLQELFQRSKSRLQFFPERIRKVGMLRKKYFKEATVFRLRLPNAEFLRGDHSVDLYKARQEIIAEIVRAVGEVRDFNGGMISKQIEVFVSLKKLLGEVGQNYEFLLENFYHSIFPIEMRSVLEASVLKDFFLLFLEMSKVVLEKQNVEKLINESGKYLFVIIAVQDFSRKQAIFDSIEHRFTLSPNLICMHLQMFDISYLGYICSFEERDKKDLFIQTINESVK